MGREVEVLFFCEECGSTNVEFRVWYNPNTKKIDYTYAGDLPDSWCNDCQEHTNIASGNLNTKTREQ